jgi:hypothetical protein
MGLLPLNGNLILIAPVEPSEENAAPLGANTLLTTFGDEEE